MDTNTETKRTIGQQRVPQIRLKHDIDNCLGPFITVVRASQRRGIGTPGIIFLVTLFCSFDGQRTQNRLLRIRHAWAYNHPVMDSQKATASFREPPNLA